MDACWGLHLAPGPAFGDPDSYDIFALLKIVYIFQPFNKTITGECNRYLLHDDELNTLQQLLSRHDKAINHS